MEQQLTIYNTLDRKKELFIPPHAPCVGMYVYGPTVYGDLHLGHTRPAITFDLLFRYLMHIDYRICYVCNIADAGHLEHGADDGGDKIAKKTRLEQLEPMKVVQCYINRYHQTMDALNVLSPSIEPHASGHITEQIALMKRIMKNRHVYESEGSVYFDMVKYNKDHHHSKLSGRSLDDVLNTSRELDGQSEKHSPANFTLWKCTRPEHIMCWPNPRSDSFPGWYIGYVAMDKKYLGENFDIHGGGMDLIFPHHECEIAQSVASQGHDMVHCQTRNNMLTVDGQKMGKSYGNFAALGKLFTGMHPILGQAYSPMIIRFFTLRAHYRSMVDFSNEAPQVAEKGLTGLMGAVHGLGKIMPTATSTVDAKALCVKCYEAMNDDPDSPIVIVHLFENAKTVNNILAGNDTTAAGDLKELKEASHLFCFDILGLGEDNASNAEREAAFEKVVNMLLEEHMEAKANKDWATNNKIRNELTTLGFEIKDSKDGCEWKLNK